MKQHGQAAAPQAEQSDRRAHVAHARCYTAAQIVGFLQISARTFFELKRRGQLPFLEELRPRLGRTVRYRADLVDRYLAGGWQNVHARKSAVAQPFSSTPLKGHSKW